MRAGIYWGGFWGMFVIIHFEIFKFPNVYVITKLNNSYLAVAFSGITLMCD